MKDLLITMIGPDATGVVARLARILAQHQGNWLDSRLMRLGGSFSGILRVSLDPGKVASFSDEVSAFMASMGYQHTLQEVGPEEVPMEGITLQMDLSGQDHPGIIEGVFRVVGECGANVDELHSGLKAAPWSGSPIFEASASLKLPASVSIDDFQSRLEGLASDLLVDLRLTES